MNAFYDCAGTKGKYDFDYDEGCGENHGLPREARESRGGPLLMYRGGLGERNNFGGYTSVPWKKYR